MSRQPFGSRRPLPTYWPRLQGNTSALSVLDFGAVGDGDGNGGGTDNAAALQAAIDAAQVQGRALFIPVGRFMVNSTLVVGCSEIAITCPSCPPVKGCAAHGPPLEPLRMFGEDRFFSIIATIQPLHAVIEFASAPPGAANAGGTSNHELSEFTVDGGGLNGHFGTVVLLHSPPTSGDFNRDREWVSALLQYTGMPGLNACVKRPAGCAQANFSIYARSITKSTFRSLNVINTKIACMSLAYGWINRVTDCHFTQCFIGLHLWDQANNADIFQNNFDGIFGVPIIIEQAAQVNIEGNVIEGNAGPGIVASSVDGLTISSNYFEVRLQSLC